MEIVSSETNITIILTEDEINGFRYFLEPLAKERLDIAEKTGTGFAGNVVEARSELYNFSEMFAKWEKELK